MSIIKAIKTRGRRIVTTLLLDFGLPAVYRHYAKQPIDEQSALFVEASSPVLSNSMQAAFDFVQNERGCTPHFVSLAQHRTGFRTQARKWLGMTKRAATAKAVFYCEGSKPIGALPARPETAFVQLWHGCGAFKRFGMSTAELKFGGDRKEQLRHPLYKNADIVAISSPEVAWAYEEAMSLPSGSPIIQPTGVARTDLLLDPEFQQWAREQVATALPQTHGRKLVLYAPTFRGRVATAEAPAGPDLEELAHLLGNGWSFVIKQHPHVKEPPAVPEGAAAFAFNAPSGLPTEALMAAADVVVTDYSSLAYECALIDVPIAYFADDLDDYEGWRGFYYPYEELTPGPISQTTEQLAKDIKKLAQEGPGPELAAFRERFMRCCDGHATERICTAALTGELPSRMQDNGKKGSSSTPDVSVVIPAYNAEAFIAGAIESAASQNSPECLVEIVVIDDGSTDATWRIIQQAAEKHPDVVKPLQMPAPSGSPAAPRNRGLAEASGEFVFFLDADDELLPRALPRMLNRAREWQSDVLLVRMIPEGGRSVPRKQFKGNVPKADMATSGVLETLGPCKLFRRSIIEQNGIRFPEGFMPEDMGFVIRAMAAAHTVSVAGDAGYHLCRMHDADSQSTFSTWDNPQTVLEALEDALDAASPLPAEAMEQSLLPRLLRRDLHRMLRTAGSLPESERRAIVSQARALFKDRYTEQVAELLPAEARIACDIALTLDEDVATAALPLIASRQLVDTCEYETSDDSLSYKLPLSTGETLTGDITHTTTATLRLDRIDWAEAGFIAVGTLKCGVAFGAFKDNAHAAIVARRGEREIVWPATLEWHDALNGEGEREVSATWNTRIDFRDLPTPDTDASNTWKLYYRVSYGAWSREARLAQSATALARLVFASCAWQGANHGKELTAVTPGTSPYGKFDVTVCPATPNDGE